MFQSPYGVLGVCRISTGSLGGVLSNVFQSPYGVFWGLQAAVASARLGYDGEGFSPLTGF